LEQKSTVANSSLQNGWFSAKFNVSSSIELLCKTEDLCFDLPAIAKPETLAVILTNLTKQTEER